MAVRRIRHPLALLAVIVVATGLLSALLVNDTVCVVMAPLVLAVARRFRRDPVPYLIAVAAAANVGGAATLTGNPQNMIVGAASAIPYRDFAAAGAPHAFEDYEIGERIDHVDGMCVEEAEHQLATRLYQNTAKVHFNQYERAKDPTGRRLVYGGVVISTAKALSFNGLQNAGLILAINGGRHVAPFFAGGTVFAWSQVLDKADLGPVGALRLRLVATKDRPCDDFPDKEGEGAYNPAVILDFDYWAAVPKRG